MRSATVVAGVHGLTSFTEEMRTLALAASSRLVEANRIDATLEIADALEIALGDPVIRLKRLRLGNGLPIGIQIVAPAHRELDCLKLAHAYETANDWIARRPPPLLKA